MSDLIQLCGYFAIVFASSVGAGYVITSIKVRRVKLPLPLPGASLQVRTGTSIYRSRFQEANPMGWIIGAPLSRDSHVPIRVGEILTIWAPTSEGLRQFESEVLLRDCATHELTIAKPLKMTAVERRQSTRRRTRLQAFIDGEQAVLVDISQGGARLFCEKPICKGERVSLTLPGKEPVFGWALDARGGPQREVRLRFEEPLKV
jgi:hypothetical protein